MKKFLFIFFMFTFLISNSLADSTGVWHYAEDIRGGIFGFDEQPVSNYTFINKVYFNDDVFVSKIFDIFNSSFYLDLNGDSKLNNLEVNQLDGDIINSNTLFVENSVGIGVLNPITKLDINGSIKISYDKICNSEKEGTIRYNFENKAIEFCDGDSWNLFSVDNLNSEVILPNYDEQEIKCEIQIAKRTDTTNWECLSAIRVENGNIQYLYGYGYYEDIINSNNWIDLRDNVSVSWITSQGYTCSATFDLENGITAKTTGTTLWQYEDAKHCTISYGDSYGNYY